MKFHIFTCQRYISLDKKDLEEQNLNTVILLNPKNEEATYNLAKLKLDASDYKKSKELNDKLTCLCNKFCNESQKLKKEKLRIYLKNKCNFKIIRKKF